MTNKTDTGRLNNIDWLISEVTTLPIVKTRQTRKDRSQTRPHLQNNYLSPDSRDPKPKPAPIANNKPENIRALSKVNPEKEITLKASNAVKSSNKSADA